VRICHWITVVAFGYLVVSGMAMLFQFPELYWGKVGFRGHEAVFKFADWGLSWDEAAKLGNRRWGRNYHYLFAWVFVINGLVYLAWNLWQKHFQRHMLPSRRELTAGQLTAELKAHGLFSRPVGEAARDYSTLQKLAYSLVVFVLLPFMLISGLAQMPAFTAIAPWLIDLFGGRQTARTLHVVGMMVLLLFLAVHVLRVVATGPVNQVRAMITGKYLLTRGEEQ
jgi:thiosulfate reductase cytochrome b subunit